MLPGSRKISIIVAPHGSSKSWNRVVSEPVLIGLALALITLVLLTLFLLLQVADLAARAREVESLRSENTEMAIQLEGVEALEAELSRLQVFETRIRRWAGIDLAHDGAGQGAGLATRWQREDARLAEIPALAPLEGWVSLGFEPGPDGHAGVDLVQEVGTPIRSAALGVVRFAGWNETYGNLVILDHGNGFTTTYGHNETLMVQEGDLVPRGQIIANLGNTGRSSAPHLHFEIRLEDEPLDPAFLVELQT
ncbi:MAG: hypothetical protein DHS20C21_03890 [Gemmatimonadota bacterium]|nr:MAG: hypothetical protein DHS20C21_03890 [Gemmatimonadota bacterium]